MCRPSYLDIGYCAALLLFAAQGGAVHAQSVVVAMVDGRTMNGEIATWDSDHIELSANDQKVAIAPTELLEVRRVDSPETSKKPSLGIELVDDSRLPVTGFTMNDRIADVDSPLSDGALKIPAEQIRIVRLVAGDNLTDAPLDATGDSIAVLKKDSTDVEFLNGVIGDVSAQQVEFTWDGDTIPVKRSKVAALLFFQKENGSAKASPLCYIFLSSGARLAAKQIRSSAGTLQVTTVAGLDLQVKLADLIYADYSVGKLTYVSDMRPLKSVWTPLVELPAAAKSIRNFGAPRNNISFMGSALTLSWPAHDGATRNVQTYAKGLALRSRTELEYRLPKGMRRFVATAGIDPDTASQGHIQLRIEADGETIFEQAISGAGAPVEIEADIANRQRLKIFVDYGDNLDLGDRLHLVEARLVK